MKCLVALEEMEVILLRVLLLLLHHYYCSHSLSVCNTPGPVLSTRSVLSLFYSSQQPHILHDFILPFLQMEELGFGEAASERRSGVARPVG